MNVICEREQVPVRLEECVAAVLRSGGGAVRVTEERMKHATIELAKLGLCAARPRRTCARTDAAYRPGSPPRERSPRQYPASYLARAKRRM